MKSIGSLVVLVVIFLVSSLSNVTAQRPSLKIGSASELHLIGHTDNYYQVEMSTNLVTWTNVGTYFSFSNTPYVQTVSLTNAEKKFFRARALFSTTNNSYISPCAEYDSVDVPLYGDVEKFLFTATHPTYTVTNYSSQEDFSNCPADIPDTNYYYSALPDQGIKIFDNGTDYLIVKRGSAFWRPQSMSVFTNGALCYNDIHYIEIGRKIPGVNQWPIFFVLYTDGNVRLIPFPPVGQSSVTFGSSVIVGPAPVAYRPFVDISAVNYHTASRTLDIEYLNGGSATLDLNDLTRTNATVKVTVNYQTDKPFCTFRSMFVEIGNCDVDSLVWKDVYGVTYTNSIMSFVRNVGTEWFFTRFTSSKHNNSSPDIKIILE